MKNWVVKLLVLLFIPSLAGILFTVALGFNPGGWLQITTYAFPPLLTLAGGAFIIASRWKIPFLILMAADSMAFNFPLQNWLFHSADEVVRYHAVTDLYNGGNNALYFTFDTLEVDYARRSSVTVTREVTRSMGRHRYRKEQKQYHFSVAPAFTDSLPRHKYEEREVKAWVIPVRHEKGQAVVCYERCIFDLDDYQKAIDRSRCKLHHPQAPIIRPLYSQFITRQEWKGIFLNVAWIVLSVLMVLGVILNYQADRKKA